MVEALQKSLGAKLNVKEGVDLYSQLGCQVRAESLLPGELSGECEGYRARIVLQFKTIYIRK
ncbi:MAG: hypothetical protein LAN18_11115 [Acidobacteriia bacterium]|nr:hypothetical protein [Terriglobia bacterium]